MCGITGYIGQGDQKILKKMTETISHRGPDDKGFFIAENCGLGHCRLSIIDIKGGHQPIYNETQNLVIIYNGEIYNYKEIQAELKNKGHIFKTNSDTEVIIHSFEEWGEKCLDRFNGMFAFVIWNKKNRSLFIARDRLGIKPLYYTIRNNNLVFASEIKSILEYPGIKKEINYEALDHYFTFRYTPLNNTIFNNIKKFPPASFGIFKNNKLIIKQYWKLNFEEKEQPTNTLNEFYDRFEKSVRKRLISEAPLGAYLSGGVDSSFIVGIMSQITKPIETFSVGFKDKKYNELPYAQKVAHYFKTNHHPFITKSDSFDLLSKIIWHMDEPVADASTIPTFQLSKLTKKFATVILTGEGSDELLAGYPKYKALLYGEKIRKITKKFNLFKSKNIFWKRASEYLSGSNITQAYLDLTSVFNEQEKEKLYSQDLKKKLKNTQKAKEIIDPYFKNKNNFLNQLLKLDIETWLPNDLLIKNDRMTMAHGLEARVPYLDYELVEFMASLPNNLKIKNFKDKYILRQAAKKILPASITKRKKQGFTVPLELFLKRGKEVLSRENIEKDGLFNYNYIEYILKQNLNKTYWRRQFWTLLTFQIWHRTFI